VFAHFIFVLLLSYMLLTSIAQAKIRKCILNNGHVVYTDVGCPEQTLAKIQTNKQRATDPFAGMSDIERNVAMSKRNMRWEKDSKKACLNNIEDYAKTLQPNFSELIVKRQHKLVTRSSDLDNIEYVHRISFFFMANDREWESSGNCHAIKHANAWDTSFRRVTTGIPYISARKPPLERTANNALTKKPAVIKQYSVEDLAVKNASK